MKNASHILAILTLASSLGGCVYGTAGIYPISVPLQQPVARVPVSQSQSNIQTLANIPTLEVNAPLKDVRDAIISRAKARGTSVASVESSGVVLEKVLQQSPPALENSCGPHKAGRKIRVLLGTADQGPTTLVSEQRFVVDDGAECRIQLTQDVVDDAKRSLRELKSDAENRIARR